MAENKLHALLHAYSLGCLNNDDFQRLRNYMESRGDYPYLELGEYQNLVALIPSILEIETPPKSVKESIARSLYAIKDEAKEKRRRVIQPVIESTPDWEDTDEEVSEISEEEVIQEEEIVPQPEENIVIDEDIQSAPADSEIYAEEETIPVDDYFKKYTIDDDIIIEEDSFKEEPDIDVQDETKKVKTTTEEVLKDILYDQEIVPPSGPSEIQPPQPSEITPADPGEEITPVEPGEEITPVDPGEEISPPEPVEQPEKTPEEVPPSETPEETPERTPEETPEKVPDETPDETPEETEPEESFKEEEIAAETEVEALEVQKTETVSEKTEEPVAAKAKTDEVSEKKDDKIKKPEAEKTEAAKPKRSLGDFLATAEPDINPEEITGSIEFEDYFAAARKTEVRKQTNVRERPAAKLPDRENKPAAESVLPKSPRVNYEPERRRSSSGGSPAGKVFYVLFILLIAGGSYFYFSGDLNKYMAANEEMQTEIAAMSTTLASHKDLLHVISMKDSRTINLSGSSGHGKVIYSPDLEKGYITISGIGDLKSNMSYYFWINAGGRNYVAARLTAGQIKEEFFPFTIHKVSLRQSLRMSLTEEPLGGSQSPSSTVLLSGSN
jgi:hypothetical protein